MQSETTQVAVPITEQTAVVAVKKWAYELTVTNNDERANALAYIARIKAITNNIVKFFAEPKQKAFETHKAIVAQEKAMTDSLRWAEDTAKKVVIAYDREQEAKRLEEQRKLQEAAEKEAEKERARLEKQAEKLKTPELKEARLEQAASVVVPTIVVQSQVEAVKGVSKRVTWKARVVNKNVIPLEYLIVDQSKLDAVARATKGTILIDGVEFYSEESLNIKQSTEV